MTKTKKAADADALIAAELRRTIANMPEEVRRLIRAAADKGMTLEELVELTREDKLS